MKKIKKGDLVFVNNGKDKGKTGKVLSVQADRVIVEGINIAKKHIKANPHKGEQGRIQEVAKPIHISNVNIYDEESGKASRVGIRTENDKRVRYFKTTGKLIDIKA